MATSYILKNIFHILALLFVLFISGCSGGVNFVGGTETGNPQYSATGGVAQKGPLQMGSLVTAQEINARFSPNGKQYTYQVNSNLGTFTPNNLYTSQYIDLSATGYYYDETTNAVSTGQIILNGVSDLNERKVLNINLLTTLAYQRIKKLVTTSGMSIAAARTQAENEVLAVFNIPNGSRYGNFSTLDISKGRDGDYILAAISSIFVLGNNAGDLSASIARFQFDIAEDGVLNDAALKAALVSSARALDTTVVAANLSAKYAPNIFTANDLNNWLDRTGDAVVGKFRFQVDNAGSSSTFTLPAFAVNQLAGLPISVSAGQFKVNGSIMSGEVTFKSGDTVVIVPPVGALPAGILTIYLKSGATTFACVTFNRGLTAVTVTPENPSIARGLTRQFVATGAFTDGSTADISNMVAWSSSSSSIASISSTGLAKGIATGSTIITAVSGAINGSTSLNVTTAVLQSISIKPANPYTGIGLTESLTATGAYSDGTNNNITNSVTWSSNDTAVATINAATGLVAGVASGTSVITASYASITGITTFTVTDNPWSASGSMATARYHHSATLLNNGKVLVAGGSNEGNLASTELYNPATNTWSAAGSMGTARTYNTATLLANGKVLVVGGTLTVVGLASAELYDPAINTWSAAGSMTTGRTGHTATLLNNGKVLVAGGIAGAGQADLTSSELYDPATSTWSAAGSMTTGRKGHTATMLNNGKVLVAGGSSSTSAELYDPATNTWSAAGSLSTVRERSHTATILADGKVLVIGGYNQIVYTLASAELYDPATNTWSATGSLSTTRQNHTATRLGNGKVLVTGGSYNSVFISSTELYDPATNTWSAAGNMSMERTLHTATLLANGKVLMAGGQGSNWILLASVELSWRW